MEEFSNHCRFCACGGIFELDIFKQDNECNSSIAEDLFKLCNIKLENIEGLPTKICTNCNLSVTNLKDFLTNLNKTQQMLLEFQNYFNRMKTKCELLNATKNQENENIEFSLIEYLEGSNKDNCSNYETESKIDGLKNSFCKQEKHKISDILEATNGHNIEQEKKIDHSNENQQLKTDHDTLKDQRNILKRYKDYKKTNTIIECELCGQKCSNQRGLSVHKRKKHVNEESEKSVSLEKIKKKEENKTISENSSENEENFTNDDYYSEIISNHEENEQKRNTPENSKSHYENDNKATVKIYKCNLCDRNCTSKSGLTLHIKRHNNEDCNKKKREYLCPHCDRKFTSVNGRWSHIHTVHDNSMRVICDECGKEFPTKYHLFKHKVIHKEIKDLQCPHCPAKFKRQSGLHVHVAIHGESFSCEICGLILNTQKLLNQHMIVHSDIKKYKCNFCDKNFKRTRNLYSHIETHVGIRAFQCCACNMSFVQYMSYRKHLKRTHPEKFAEMVTKGERISTSNALSSEQLKAINEAAKNGENYKDLKKQKLFENI